jgi:hypothetical protein
MINQNARRTGAAGVITRALGTLGAATLLLTSTGWGALAGDTGFGAINPNAYQGAATLGAQVGTGDAAKAGLWEGTGYDPLIALMHREAEERDREMQQRFDKERDEYYKRQREAEEANAAAQNWAAWKKDREKGVSVAQFTNDIFDTWAQLGDDGSTTTTAPAPGSGSSVASSGPTTTTTAAPNPPPLQASTTTAAPNLPPLQASTDTPAEAAAKQAASDAHDAAIDAQIAMQAAQDEKTALYFAYKYDHLTPGQEAAIARAGGYPQLMAILEQKIDALGRGVDQAWANYTEAQNMVQARGGQPSH